MPATGAITEHDTPRGGQVILTSPESDDVRGHQARAESFGIKYSPLSRKIVTFNLVALCLMMTGILYLNQFDEGLINLREQALETDARFVSEAIGMTAKPIASDGIMTKAAIDAFTQLSHQSDTHMQLFDAKGTIVAYSALNDKNGEQIGDNSLIGRDGALEKPGPLSVLRDRLVNIFSSEPAPPPTLRQRLGFTEGSLQSALAGNLRMARVSNSTGHVVLTAALPLIQNGTVAGAIVLSTEPGEIDAVVRNERSQILRIFFLAMVINVILSMALANTIAHPLQELAEAAEKGGASNARRVNPERIEIPDLTGRPDEIGYLAGALKSMTTALYDRIDANETFAADVAHEIKNPLTSLRSAVDTMKYAKDDAGREKLLKVIQMDVTRLDRLVTDISNASRLDSELVRDEMASFDLNELLTNLVEYNQAGAEKVGGKLIADLDAGPLEVRGLEGRLAQVFVNLITNAISFTEEDGVITVRAKVINGGKDMQITVEDSGPGIPDDNLEDVFSRFYSERPGQQFGDHSGLGLAISKQIIDAHSGSIHAENVRAEGASDETPPDGARFVVVLPK